MQIHENMKVRKHMYSTHLSRRGETWQPKFFLLDKSCLYNRSSQLSGDISDDVTSCFLVMSALLRVS